MKPFIPSTAENPTSWWTGPWPQPDRNQTWLRHHQLPVLHTHRALGGVCLPPHTLANSCTAIPMQYLNLPYRPTVVPPQGQWAPGGFQSKLILTMQIQTCMSDSNLGICLLHFERQFQQCMSGSYQNLKLSAQNARVQNLMLQVKAWLKSSPPFSVCRLGWFTTEKYSKDLLIQESLYQVCHIQAQYYSGTTTYSSTQNQHSRSYFTFTGHLLA